MKRSRTGHYLYTASLFFLIFLAAVCIAISAADVIIQALADHTESNTTDYRNLFVVAASYVLLALASLSFSCSRFFTVRASMQDIPKIYIPIKEDDLPKKVYTHIHQKFDYVQQVRKAADPRVEDIGQIAWGKPGSTPFEGVNFKRAITRTPSIIEQAATQIDGEFTRLLYTPVRQYIEFLIQRGLIDAHLGQVYLEGYERSRFSQASISEDEYLDIMKHLAAILHQMGYRLSKNPNFRNDSYGDSTVSSSSTTTTTSTSRQQIPPSFQRSGSSSPRPPSPPPPVPSATSQEISAAWVGRPRDDDVVSLAQSVGTWTSRSTNTMSRGQRSSSQRGRVDDDIDYDDEFGHNEVDYDREMRNLIYQRFLADRFNHKLFE
ncbi:hypothetical protein VTP01DRAFT_4837 [Rhizomucor pusillus]|uniref:uncharacterized protein n=1 Tax=Rhizomucor pusillus TaxID=4840 RepID=UPI00374250CB